jgi:RNA 3'-terminal phosphate cyclase (ATP)
VNKSTHIRVDGSVGEGGGQILRTSLALSLVTGKPFRIERIRARRARPGLLRQHLTAVEAAAAVGQARTRGAAIGSTELSFEPRAVVPGNYRFAVGTAGSATLVMQTILPALVLAKGPSELTLSGGTHNPFAPPFDFIDRAFLPLLCRMGPRVEAVLERPGFYPAGGGRFRVTIEPTGRLEPIEVLERGAIVRKLARAIVSSLPFEVAERELRELSRLITIEAHEMRGESVQDPLGPGNVLIVEIESEGITEVFTGFGERGVAAEKVARDVGDQIRDYLRFDVPVGEHLADQLLVPMALAGGGAFRTSPPSRHTLTNVDVIRMFLDGNVQIERENSGSCRIEFHG